MAFIDEIKIYAKAGDGGNGVVRWLKEKSKPWGGPAGGDGGRGGDVYIRAVRDITALAFYRHQKEFFAENGDPGGAKSLHGKNGEALYLDLPVGSIIRNLKTNQTISLLKEGQEELILTAGVGGYGNEHFKASTNTTPKEWTPGKPGEDGEFFVELQLFADVGLVGMPNAGKSSLLNNLTRASAKVGDYPFTTLDPNLGEFHGYILADIPGLIEGAGEGKGLGTKFLRHIKRTKLLAHLISFENEEMLQTYKQIRKELESYDKELADKEEIIVLTKTDLVDDKTVQKIVKEFSKLKKQVFSLSLYDDKSIKDFSTHLSQILTKINS